MNHEGLIEVGSFSPRKGSGLKIFFEPRCEDLEFDADETITIYAKCPDGPNVDLPAEIDRDLDQIVVHSKRGNAVWYVQCRGTVTATLEEAIGKEVSNKIEKGLLNTDT